MSLRRCARTIALAGLAAVAGCDPAPLGARAPSPSPPPPALAEAAPDPLPPSDPTYATRPTPGWTDGNDQSALAERVTLAAFRARGQAAQGDGRLALLARWAAGRFARSDTPDAMTVDAVARRVGYVGPPPFVFAFKGTFASEDAIRDELNRQFATIPGNVVLTHYGVATITSGGERATGIVLAAVELTLDALPKRASRERKLHLAGKVAERFDRVRLSVTLPSGKVENANDTDRSFTSDLTLTEAGVHRVELLGEGKSGPVVVANFPVYVDVDEPDELGSAAPADADAALTPAQAEVRMLELVNSGRAGARIGALLGDEELAAVARAHSQDMADHDFFGHVSPTTGDSAARIRRARFPMTRFGENVARARSAQEAYAVLMASPGHRGNMLDPGFTHAGVGAAVRVAENGAPLLYVTCVFAQRRR